MKEFIYSIYLGNMDWSDAVRPLDDEMDRSVIMRERDEEQEH